MQLTHAIKMLKEKHSIHTPYGKRHDAVQRNFPALDGMAAYVVEINPGCFREPHWHPNTVELAYCLQGKARITIFMDGSIVETFSVEAGDLFFVPKGFLHSIENLDKEISRFLTIFANENPEDFGLSGFYGSMPQDIIADVFKIKDKVVSQMPKANPKDCFFGKSDNSKDHPKIISPYKLALESSQPALANSAGSVKMGKQSSFPILENLALYSLTLNSQGVREPHWHPNCAEMGFVNKGSGKLLIRFPDGRLESFVVNEGDLYFIPPAYPHYIEPTDHKGFHFLIAFNAVMPQDIGISGTLSAFDPAMVSSTLAMPPQNFHIFKSFGKDVFITDKV